MGVKLCVSRIFRLANTAHKYGTNITYHYIFCTAWGWFDLQARVQTCIQSGSNRPNLSFLQLSHASWSETLSAGGTLNLSILCVSRSVHLFKLLETNMTQHALWHYEVFAWSLLEQQPSLGCHLSNLWCLLLLSCHIHLVVLRLSFCLAIPCPHSFCVCWFGFHGCTWRCDQGNLKMLLYATLFCGFPLCTMLCSIEALTAGATDAMNRSRWEWVNWLKTRKIMAPNLFFSARGSSFLEEEAWAILRPITICSFSVARLGANKFVP